MGITQCTKCVGGSSLNQNTYKDNYDEQPEDTQSLVGIDLSPLTFHGLLRKFKLKNVPPNEKYHIKITIGDIEELILASKNADEQGNIKWNIQEKLVVVCTEYQLRKKSLRLELFKSSKQAISFLSINLYKIAIGPYHLDFAIPISSKRYSRISFDIKIAQVVPLTIEPETVEIQKVKQFYQDKYAFSLRTMIGNNFGTQSISSVCEVKKQKNQGTSSIRWEPGNKSHMPVISNNIPFYDFHYSTLQIIFWRIDDIDKVQPSKMFGQCYISFAKLLTYDSSILSRGNHQYQIRNIQLIEKLWNHGNQCGTIKMKLKFSMQKHLKQMLVFVRTEKGITKNSPVFQTVVVKTKSNCKQIVEILKISQKMSFNQIQIEKRKDQKEIYKKDYYRQIDNSLGQLLILLEATNKQTIKFYNYVNQAQLLKGQSVLLDLGNKIIKYMDEQFEFVQSIKWKVLSSLVKRGQFKLNYIGFNASIGTNNADLYNKKVSIAIKYQQLLHEMLNLTIKIFAIKRYDEERAFAEMFCAIAYFRIPEFRKKLLELITRKDDPQIQEWRGTDFSLTDKIAQYKTSLPGQNTFEVLFDWEKYFYKHIKKNPAYETNIAHLNEIMKQEEWKIRISKRRGAFFAFIRQWISFVEFISIRMMTSNWKHFPGYKIILRSFIVEMKLKPIYLYPHSIKAACQSLLVNENLLNIFITIIFKKTNLNNNIEVMKTLQLVNNFFAALKDRNKKIPSTFNYKLFYDGMKMILINQYSFTVAKALYVLYQNFDLFGYQFRIQLARYLLGQNFFKWFLHWSQNVRQIFHHLLILRIYYFFTEEQNIKSMSLRKEDVDDLAERYDSLLAILQNMNNVKEKQFVPTYEKDLVSKLKKNMRKKKKEKTQSKVTGQETDSKQSITQFSSENRLQHTVSAYNSSNKLINQSMSLPFEQPVRFDSQIISQEIIAELKKKAESDNKYQQKQQVIRRKKNQSDYQRKYSHSLSEGELDVYDEAKISMAFNNAEQIQMPILSEKDSQYIIQTMKQFEKISKQYLKSLKQMQEAPKLKVQLKLDSGQMRPIDYAEIEEW